jgi:uncharacterized protein YbcI
VLEDTFTPAERTLIGAGKAEQVHATRRAFQEAVASQFIDIVHQASGRKVRAFMSMVNLDPELSCELFLLEPEEHGGDVQSGDGAVSPEPAE